MLLQFARIFSPPGTFYHGTAIPQEISNKVEDKDAKGSWSSLKLYKSGIAFFKKYSAFIFWMLCLLFFITACLQSLTLHHEYFSNNADLGFHNQLMYKFAHFKQPSSTLWNVQYGDQHYYLKNCFGDHVTLLMPLNSQLYWLFGSYALLIAQVIYCLAGAWGIYKLISFKCESTLLALAGVVLFFTHYSLYAALDFDAHDNVYGIMFLPWILYFYYKENFRAFIICLLLFLIARDDLALTGIFMGISLLVFDWKKRRKFALTCFLVSLGYFLLVFYFLIPYLSSVPRGGYNAWRFGALGGSIPEVVRTVLTKPVHTLGLFIDTPEKKQKFTYFLLTGGALLIFRPRFLLFFFPTFFVTCLSDDWNLWGNLNHYNIIFSVLLPFIVISSAYYIRSEMFRTVFLLSALYLNLYCLEKNPFRGWSYFDRIFTAEFYNRRSNMPEIKEALDLIPASASMSATSHFTPHLAFRERAYCYPDIDDAEYIAISEASPEDDFYPFASPEEFKFRVNQLRENSSYELIFEKNKMLLFRKKKNWPPGS